MKQKEKKDTSNNGRKKLMTMEDKKIFAMEAGKALDDKVASKVMGGKTANYSKDIATAWKVVEKLKKMGWRIDIMSSKKREEVGGIKMIHGTPVSLSYLAGNVESDNLPEAICKAALLIVNSSHRLADIESRLAS